MMSMVRQIMVAAIISQLVLPAQLFAAQRSAVVVPMRDGVSDKISEDLTVAFSNALARHGLQVVSKEKAEAVLGYYQKGEGKKTVAIGELAKESEQSLIRAKEHYYNFDYAEASAQVERAIKIMESSQEDITEHGTFLRDSYITAGIIEKSEKRRDEAARGYFRKALGIDPQYELDERAFPPSVVEAFSAVRSELSVKPTGSVSVETDPMVAEVYVNGVLKGVTPIIISGLPEGKYSIAIKTNKYSPVTRSVDVKAESTAKIKEKLYWLASAEKNPPEIQNLLTSKDEATEQIVEGVRIAELLRVQKVIMVDADEAASGGGEIAVRMIDRKYKAGHNPIVVRYSKDKNKLAADLSEATAILAKQSQVAILDNPQKSLDPDGVGDPVLLGKRNRMLWTAPAFLAVVGGVLAAGAGGAAAAVIMSNGGGGGGSGAGSVNVSFK